jgi:hypothetical protein
MKIEEPKFGQHGTDGRNLALSSFPLLSPMQEQVETRLTHLFSKFLILLLATLSNQAGRNKDSK